MVRTVALFACLLTFVATMILAPNSAAQTEGKSEKSTSPAKAAESSASHYRVVLGKRQSNVDGKKTGMSHTSGAAVEVAQPQSDSAVFSITGVAVTGGLPLELSASNVVADVVQDFRLQAPPGTRQVRLQIDGQLIGQLAGNRDGIGTASMTMASVDVTSNQNVVTSFAFEPRTHSGRDSLFINDKQEPIEINVPLVDFTLHIHFEVGCNHPRSCFHKNVVSAVFGTDLGKVPEWLNMITPVREMPKSKDLGFRVGVRALAVK